MHQYNLMAAICLPPALRYASLNIGTTRGPLHSHRRLFTAATPATRSYEHALTLLDSLQSNRAVTLSISDTAGDINRNAMPEMLEWTRRAGYNASDFGERGLRCIHVAGTKGKGSVSAMIESILLQFRGEDKSLVEGRRKHLGKIGMYTSPHLVTVRERIRIDGSLISESQFTNYFFELWDRFEDAASKPSTSILAPETRPGFFRYLTLMAFHAFIQEGVETAIVECGIGGTYDSTNILGEAVKCTAITKLGIDHVGMLGESIEEIASHKAGIIKNSVPIFSAIQLPAAQAVLDSKAKEKMMRVQYIDRHPALENSKIKLGLEGDFQKDNASLSISVASSYLQSMQVAFVPPSPEWICELFIQGLEAVKLSGRCQVLHDKNIDWLVDGAHTEDSIKATAEWYVSKLIDAYTSGNPPTTTVLIFNQQERNGPRLLRLLMSAIDQRLPPTFLLMRCLWYSPDFQYAMFCRNTPFKSNLEEPPDLGMQESIGKAYKEVARSIIYELCDSVEEAVEFTRRIAKGEGRALVLVTGSLHLAGGLLKVLEREMNRKKEMDE